MKNFIVFDLDGTLLDTLPGIQRAVNRGLAYYHYPYNYDLKTIKTFVGNGARRLFLLATKKDHFDDVLEIQYNKFLEFYKEEQCDSKPYDEVFSTLRRLNQLGIKLIVFSNKPDKLAKIVVKSVLKDINFTLIQGQLENYPVKPDVTLLNKCLSDLNLNSLNGIYVGDSLTDNQTAMNAQLDFVFVTYGYSSTEDRTKIFGSSINKFSEILEFLK